MRVCIKAIAATFVFASAATSAPAGTVISHAAGPGGHTYELVEDSVTWSQANAAASALGGYLSTIGEAAEQSVVEQMLTDSHAPSGSYWFGLTQPANRGGYKYLSGANAVYTHWLTGEPNDFFGTESYGSVLWSNVGDPTIARAGFWNDLVNGLGYPQVASVYPDLIVKGYVVEFKGTGPNYDNGDRDPLIVTGGAPNPNPTPVPLPAAALAAIPAAGMALAAWRKNRAR